MSLVEITSRRRINPARKIPVLVDGDLVLTESVAIVLYLGEKYRERHFVPTNPAERAKLHRWLLFAATELEQPLWRIARHNTWRAASSSRPIT